MSTVYLVFKTKVIKAEDTNPQQRVWSASGRYVDESGKLITQACMADVFRSLASASEHYTTAIRRHERSIQNYKRRQQLVAEFGASEGEL